jgi:PAS domain S-box-containing protein
MSLFVPKDRKSLFRQFLAGMYDAVVITDPNGHIIEVNPRAEEYFGYMQDEVVDKPIAFCIPGLAAEIVQRIRKGLADGRHIVIDANGMNKDGKKFACEVAVSVIDLIDPGDLVFTIRNTERRRSVNEMLRDRENAFKASPVALFACDGEGRIRSANSAFCALFGLDGSDDAKNAMIFDFLKDGAAADGFRKALAGEVATVGLSSGEGKLKVSFSPNMHGRKCHGVVGGIIKE